MSSIESLNIDIQFRYSDLSRNTSTYQSKPVECTLIIEPLCTFISSMLLR